MLQFVYSTPFTSLELLYTVLFFMALFCLLMPPIAFTSAGFTLENICAYFLGSENSNFFEYHVKRTTMMRLVFSSVLSLYWVFMFCLSESVASSSPNIFAPVSNCWDVVFWLGCLITSIGASYLYLVWYAGNTWTGHPTIMRMKTFAAETSTDDRTWRDLVNQINAECCLTDKFVDGQGGLHNNWSGRRFIVTNSWILASYFDKFTVIRQDADQLIAAVTSSTSIWDPISMTEGGRPAGDSLGTRVMVNVRFTHLPTKTVLLTWSISASALDSLRAKLSCPLVWAPGVEVEPSIVQRFVDVFASVVDENETIHWNDASEADQCIGCLSSPIDVVLRRHCDPTRPPTPDYDDDQQPTPPCGYCRCRPMWCLTCLTRWFASRLTEAHRPPSMWLSGRVPCPTCRAIFCVRDVSRLTSSTDATTSEVSNNS